MQTKADFKKEKKLSLNFLCGCAGDSTSRKLRHVSRGGTLTQVNEKVKGFDRPFNANAHQIQLRADDPLQNQY